MTPPKMLRQKDVAPFLPTRITGRSVGSIRVASTGQLWIPSSASCVTLPTRLPAESMPVLITLLYGLAALLSAAFGFMELRMLARFLRHRAAIRSAEKWRENGAPARNENVPPTVTIQIPLYNERTSAEQIVRAAAAQEYPRDRFDIQVLDDSTDETSVIVAKVSDEVRKAGVEIEHVCRGRSGRLQGRRARAGARPIVERVRRRLRRRLRPPDRLPQCHSLRRAAVPGSRGRVRPGEVDLGIGPTRWLAREGDGPPAGSALPRAEAGPGVSGQRHHVQRVWWNLAPSRDR